MIMQWFVNEVRDRFDKLEAKVKDVLDRPVIDNEERFARLEGEIKAMKARMGKLKE